MIAVPLDVQSTLYPRRRWKRVEERLKGGEKKPEKEKDRLNEKWSMTPSPLNLGDPRKLAGISEVALPSHASGLEGTGVAYRSYIPRHPCLQAASHLKRQRYGVDDGAGGQ